MVEREQSRRSQQKQQKQQSQQADLRESNIKLVWILPSARLEDEVNIPFRDTLFPAKNGSECGWKS
jgi:hypothetical protein